MRHAVRRLRQADPVLGEWIDRVGPCRIQYRDPDFATLARAIVFQQLNGKAAASIFDRVQAALSGGITAEAVLRASPRRLRAAGLSAQKLAYLRDLARVTSLGRIPFERLPGMSEDEVIEALTQVKGVGVWTAHMFLIFALRRPDVLPVGDYGVRSAMQKIYGLAELPKPPEMERIAEPWRPWRSIASWYLWRVVEMR